MEPMTYLWIAWLLVFGVLEGYALVPKKTGDTPLRARLGVVRRQDRRQAPHRTRDDERPRPPLRTPRLHGLAHDPLPDRRMGLTAPAPSLDPWRAR